MNDKTFPTSIRLSENDKQLMDEIAQEFGISDRSSLIRFLLKKTKRLMVADEIICRKKVKGKVQEKSLWI